MTYGGDGRNVISNVRYVERTISVVGKNLTNRFLYVKT